MNPAIWLVCFFFQHFSAYSNYARLSFISRSQVLPLVSRIIMRLSSVMRLDTGPENGLK